MLNFWQQLPKPFFCLAPMEGVTDFAFREMFARCSRHSSNLQLATRNSFVMFTEFINVDGLLHPAGFEKLKVDLKFSKIQRPIVAQIWGRDPEKFQAAASKLAKMGFDGIDINMGCPQEKEIAQKTCAALIKEPKLAGEIIQATIEGANIRNLTRPSGTLSSPGEGGRLPVSVKTRLGYSKIEEMENWLSHLLTYPLAAITLHARTKQEKSKVPAHWEEIKKAVEIRNHKNYESGIMSDASRTLIIGNGDIKSYQEGLDRVKETGCDGVMVGRGAFGSPWFFDFGKERSRSFPTLRDRLQIMLEHARLFHKFLGKEKPFVHLRKHFKAYVSGFNGASDIRAKLMETNNLKEVETVVNNFVNTRGM